MLDLQHQYNNCTTIPHMREVKRIKSQNQIPISCCIDVVQESNPKIIMDLFGKWLCCGIFVCYIVKSD